MDSIIQQIATELNKRPDHVENVVRLLDEGNTIPFIARYRKELHGAMDDTSLRTLEERLHYLRGLAERKEAVKSAIEEQGKLTAELSAAIDTAATLAEVEDLYRPYKQKRRTRATIAREKGLAPLAEALMAPDAPDPMTEAVKYLDPEKGVETAEDALAGASDIVAETVSDDAALRGKLRELLMKSGVLHSQAATEEDSVYRLYYDFTQALPKLQGHQILAINRGEKEEKLKVSVELDRELALRTVRRSVVIPGSAAMDFLKVAAEDAYDRLIFPSLEREARSTLTDSANEGAIGQFALNLKPLLMQPPVKGKVTMGLDPGYRMGCKVAVVDGTGKVLDTAVVYPTHGERQKKEAIAVLPDDPQTRRGAHRHRQRHRQPGDGADGGGADPSGERDGGTRELYDRLRGGRQRVLRQPSGGGGVPGVRREPAQRRFHRPAVTGPPGGAGEDRPQGHRRGPVPARHAPQAAGRGFERCGGGLCERRGRGRKHRQPLPALPRCRYQRHGGQKHRGLPGGTWSFP